MVQNGKFAACAFALVKQLNKVDLPTFGSPTIPHFNAIILKNEAQIYLNALSILCIIFVIMLTEVRIDKWIYSVRLFKSRTLAAEAVDKGKVKLNDHSVKPAHPVKVNDIVLIKDGISFRKYKVLALAEKRMSAKLVVDFYSETTPLEDLNRLEEVNRAKRSFIHFGKGRPTKKDRRDINKYLD